MDRGKIIDKQKSLQVKDYSSLRYGKITPTDIDGFIDFGNKLFIFLEFKTGDKELPFGQRLALERLVDTLGKVKTAVVIIARHDTSTDEEIDCANCKVDKWRYKNKWYERKDDTTVRQLIDFILDFFNIQRDQTGRLSPR